MVNRPDRDAAGTGRYAPARLAFAAATALAMPMPVVAGAQRPAAVVQAPAPVPDRLTLLKLLWGTMAAIDHANKTGNYSVLRDLGSPTFQANNNAASLASTFATLRRQQVDLSDTLIVQPTFEFAPAIVRPGMLRMRGSFNVRPTPIQFDLIYQWQSGWMLDAVAVRSGGPGA